MYLYRMIIRGLSTAIPNVILIVCNYAVNLLPHLIVHRKASLLPESLAQNLSYPRVIIEYAKITVAQVFENHRFLLHFFKPIVKESWCQAF